MKKVGERNYGKKENDMCRLGAASRRCFFVSGVVSTGDVELMFSALHFLVHVFSDFLVTPKVLINSL